MAGRLSRLNGWRRLWLVATAGLAVWFVGIWPVQVLDAMHVGRYSYDRAIEKDFEGGQCRAYQTEPLGKLREPGYSDGCWHIYTSRKYDPAVPLPYTLEAYKSSSSAQAREQYLYALGMGVAGTAVVSGVVYIFGWLLGWILTGFRPQH